MNVPKIKFPSDVTRSACRARTLSSGGAQAEPVEHKTRVAFFGFYGRHNFGDDLFGYLLQSIASRTPGIEPMIVGGSPTIEVTHSFHVPCLGQYWHRAGKLGAAARVVTYLVALFRAQAAIFGGGSLFGAKASLSFAKFVIDVSRRLNKPVAALGVSVGPFATPERARAFGKLLRSMSCVAVRDEDSVRAVANATRSTPVNLGDLAFALPAIYAPKRGEGSRRTLVVSIHLYDYLDTVLTILADVDRRRLVDEVVFVSLDDESVAVTGDIARLFSPSNVSVQRFEYTDSITDVVDILAGASCVVTSKLHGAIVSFVFNVPMMLFCYQRKCAAFLRDNALPGPQDVQPPAAVCVEHVARLLERGVAERRYSNAHWHLEQFSDFIADVADARSFPASRDKIDQDVTP